MSEEIEFDGGAVNDDGNYDVDEDEYGDDDEIIDDHANQDEDIDKSGKVKTEVLEDNEDPSLEINNFDDFEQVNVSNNNTNRRKLSGYPIMSFIEHTKLYSILCDYLSRSKFELPIGMLDEKEVKSCDVFRIARFWIANRAKFPLPLGIDRIIVGNNIEKVDVNKILSVEDLDFHDDNHDEHRFYYNFNSEPYGNAC